MPSLGAPEIMVILIVALLVFGPKRLPEVGRQVAKGLRELRKVQDTIRDEFDDVLRLDDDGPKGAEPVPAGADVVRPRAVEPAPAPASGARPSRFRPPTRDSDPSSGSRPPPQPRPPTDPGVGRRARAAGARAPARHRPPLGGVSPRGDAEA